MSTNLAFCNSIVNCANGLTLWYVEVYVSCWFACIWFSCCGINVVLDHFSYSKVIAITPIVHTDVIFYHDINELHQHMLFIEQGLWKASNSRHCACSDGDFLLVHPQKPWWTTTNTLQVLENEEATSWWPLITYLEATYVICSVHTSAGVLLYATPMWFSTIDQKHRD